jgi:PHD/YefM family antitoxin component YafN of YafNO toxin-antitoxin module
LQAAYGHHQGHPVNDLIPQSFGGGHATFEENGPVVLTVNGKAAAVVQDAEAYQRLLDRAAAVSVEEGIRQGREDLTDGRTRPAGEVFDEIRTAYGVPR